LLTVFSHPVSRLLGIDNSHVNTMLISGLSGICMAVHRESMAVLKLAGRLS